MPCLIAILLIVAPLLVTAEPKDYFGCYRTISYNDAENLYSNRFFMPSINMEVSNKLAEIPTGAGTRTMNFNFEVPVVTDDRVYLKFKFLEFPLAGADVLETADSLHLTLDRDFLVRNDSDQWQVCRAERHLGIDRVPQQDRLRITMSSISRTPETCPSESHALVVERVVELPCR